MKVRLIIAFLLIYTGIHAIEININNKISAWSNIFDKNSTQKYHLGARYQPKLSVTLLQAKKFRIDLDAIADLSWKYIKNDARSFDKKKAELYRGWIRYSTDQFGARVGLQKINFGPAQLIRSLQWFDTLDPRDPQESTPGVEAALLRYYFLNNANIWAWGILADEELKGREQFRSEDNSFEFGGRIQYPFEYCEAAFTYHQRKLEQNNAHEYRFGLDARWDFEIGVWIEAVAAKYTNDVISYNWENFLTLGADYTFSIGNGIHLLGEHFTYSKSEDLFGNTYATNSSAITIAYPIGLLDNVSAIVSYDWDNENWFRYISFQRVYDYISIYLNLSWNPESDSNNYDQITINGKSIQLMIIYDF